LETIPTIANLCEYYLDLPKEIMAKIVEQLLHHSRKIERESVISTQRLLRCLGNSTHDFKLKDLAVEVGALKAIGPLFSSVHVELQRLSIGAAMSISVSLKGKQELLAFPALLHRLCHLAIAADTASAIRENSICTLRNVAENVQGRELIGRELLTSAHLVEILGAHPSALLIDTLLNDSKRYEDTLHALSLLLKAENGGSVAWHITEIVPRLFKLSDELNGRARTLAAENLAHLAKECEPAREQLAALQVTEQ